MGSREGFAGRIRVSTPTASFGEAATPVLIYMGTYPFSGWGPIDLRYWGRQGIKCYHPNICLVNLHRSFIVTADMPYCDYGHFVRC